MRQEDSSLSTILPPTHDILIKKKGIFTNCCSVKDKEKAKLRLLYECAPIALCVEMSGGKSLVDPLFSDGKVMSVLLGVRDK